MATSDEVFIEINTGGPISGLYSLDEWLQSRLPGSPKIKPEHISVFL